MGNAGAQGPRRCTRPALVHKACACGVTRVAGRLNPDLKGSYEHGPGKARHKTGES